MSDFTPNTDAVDSFRIGEDSEVSEGGQKQSFDALLRYLELSESVTVPLDTQLNTEEWLEVLGIATKYEMPKIKENAIDVLSRRSLGAIEMIKYAREHRVASWLLQGIEDLLEIDPSANFWNWNGIDYETAAKVLWVKCAIRDPHSHSITRAQKLTLPLLSESSPAVFRYSEIRCQNKSCRKPFHPDGGKCKNCKTTFSSTDTFTTSRWDKRDRETGYRVIWGSVTCPNPVCGIGACMEPCSSCGDGEDLHPNGPTNSGSQREPFGVQDFIHLAFSEELQRTPLYAELRPIENGPKQAIFGTRFSAGFVHMKIGTPKSSGFRAHISWYLLQRRIRAHRGQKLLKKARKAPKVSDRRLGASYTK